MNQLRDQANLNKTSRQQALSMVKGLFFGALIILTVGIVAYLLLFVIMLLI